MSVIRGPNLPPSVTGRLEGHFHLLIKDLKLDPASNLNSGRVAFWGHGSLDYPCFNLRHENSAISVVSPVTIELDLFAEYLAEYRQLKIEFLRKTAVVTSIFIDVQERPPEKEPDPMSMKIAGRVRGNTIGSCKVSYWFIRQRGVPNSSLIYLKRLRMQHNQNKRRLVVSRGQPPSIQTVDQIFDALDKTMLEKGHRVIDLYRSCDKFKTPVVDLSSLLDRFVEAFIPRIVRQQFWLLLAPSGGALFTSAKFSQQFKLAKQSVECVRNQRSNGVRILLDLNRLIKSNTLDDEKSKINREQFMTESFLKFMEEQFPEVSNLDLQIVLVFTFVSIPDRLYWTLNEIGRALDNGLQIKVKDSDPQIPILDKAIKQEVKNKDQDQSVNEDSSKLEGGSTEVARLEDSAKKPNPVQQKALNPESQDCGGPPTNQMSLTKDGILHEMLDTMVPEDYPKATSTSLTEKLKSGSFDEELCTLISKCKEVLLNLTSFKRSLNHCRHSIVPKRIPQEILVGSAFDDSLIGTTKDLEVLSQDTYFSTLITQSKSTPPLPLELEFRDFNKLDQRELNCSIQRLDWLKLVLHEVQLEPMEESFVIIRSFNFKTQVEISKGVVIWIPHLTPNNEVVIILEFHVWDSSKNPKLAKSESKQSSRVCGFTKIKLEANVGLNSPQFEKFLIKDLFGGGLEKGSLILSLFQSQRDKETSPESRNGQIRTLGTIPKLENPSIDVQTQTESIKEDLNKSTSSRQTENQSFENSVGNRSEDLLKEAKVNDLSYIQVTIHSMKLMETIDDCFVDCYLEHDPELIKRVQILPSVLGDPNMILVDSKHEFAVHKDCFEQSLIFKVLEGDQRILGELHLDLGSLPTFHRICGPMTILNHDLNPIGVLQIDVELLTSPSEPSPKGHQGPIQPQTKIPFLTCSDDEDYVVLGGVMDTSNDNDVEIDDLCEMLTEKFGVRNSPPNREVPSPELDIFQCDDDFLLDLTKQDIAHPLDQSSTMMPKTEPENHEISVSRTSSDQLSRGDRWEFKTSLVPVGEAEKEENDDSVDIDALLEKYSVRRTPGWWRSLLDEPESEQIKNKEEEHKSDQESSESF